MKEISGFYWEDSVSKKRIFFHSNKKVKQQVYEGSRRIQHRRCIKEAGVPIQCFLNGSNSTNPVLPHETNKGAFVWLGF
ncbi:hypothetical protein [Bacillus tuaregi]|uniref:hypothetical protein n=1 Tax=Bacillus tuaregi TaxID=1816695 RepID=UPI0008F8017D|nr:hypothetical protein [Bacillus tuaregi]